MARQSDLLTREERELLSLLAQVESGFSSIIGSGQLRRQDRQRAFATIDVLNNMVAAQAAARVFPAECRLLGEISEPIHSGPEERNPDRERDCYLPDTHGGTLGGTHG